MHAAHCFYHRESQQYWEEVSLSASCLGCGFAASKGWWGLWRCSCWLALLLGYLSKPCLEGPTRSSGSRVPTCIGIRQVATGSAKLFSFHRVPCSRDSLPERHWVLLAAWYPSWLAWQAGVWPVWRLSYSASCRSRGGLASCTAAARRRNVGFMRAPHAGH